MIINTVVMTNRIRALAEDSGLQLQLCEEDIAATTGDTIYLKKPSFDWSDDDRTVWESNAYHEIGHCSPNNKDIFKVIRDKKISMRSRLGKCVNALDDLRQEHEQYGRFAGRDRVMGDGNRLMMLKQINHQLLSKPSEDPDINLLKVLFGYMTNVFEWYPAMAGMAAQVRNKLSPDLQDKLDILLDHDDEISPLGCDGKEVYKRSKRLLELLGYDPEKEEKDAQDKEKSEKQLSEAAEAFAKEIFKHLHTDEECERKAEASPGKLNKDARKRLAKAGAYMIPKDESTYNQTNWKDMIIQDYGSSPAKCSVCSKTAFLVDTGKFLGTQVRKVLQTLSQVRNIHGMKHGKLGKNLYRATMKDSGEYQQKIFKKKDCRLSLDVSITLLVDGSGSMNRDNKYEAASASAIIMNTVLSQLRINHEILVFTEEIVSGRGVLSHGIIKDFSKVIGVDQLLRNFNAFQERGLEQNLDGESIMWSAMRLLKTKTKRKILIVFSDGQPAAHTPGAKIITRKAIKELEARKDIEIYGIGLMSKSVKDYYKDSEVVANIQDLEASLLRVIKSKILTGE